MDTDNLNSLKTECGRSELYPRTVLSTRTPEHTLQSLEHQLKARTGDLFCSSGNAAIAFWELARVDEGSHNEHTTSSPGLI